MPAVPLAGGLSIGKMASIGLAAVRRRTLGEHRPFYLASIGTIQVFLDGNKRMHRFAYSVLLIKGTHGFKAPTDAHAMSLFRMQGSPPSWDPTAAAPDPDFNFDQTPN